MSVKDVENWLLKWQGVAAVLSVLGMGATALMIHGRDMQRLDEAERTIREIRNETVTRREFEILMRNIEDIRQDVRAMRSQRQ